MLKLDSVLADTPGLVPPDHLGGPPIPKGVWEAAVGSRIARRAEPVRLERDVLYVRVANSAWANELALLSGDILQQLRESGIEASALRFTVGKLAAPQPGRTKPKLGAPPNPPVPERLTPELEAVEDPELREVLSDAAAKSLALNER
jgi:hypothetical protein